MGRWGMWLLSGVFLALGIMLGTLILSAARVSPRITCWIARSALAVAVLNLLLEMVARRLSAEPE
jgi:hypothetical protein